VVAARIRILPSSDLINIDGPLPPLFAGQPIRARLFVETSFHWAGDQRDSRRSFKLRFDVEEMVKDWLVSGRKRGDFTATDGGRYEFQITLIALHHGEVSLPKVMITPLPLSDELTMRTLVVPSADTHQIHGAETVLVLPRGGRSTFVVGMGDQ